MRLLPRTLVSFSAAAILMTGCSEVQEVTGAVDKAQACLEATKIVGEMTSKVASLRDNPEQLEKALNDSAAKLEDTAAKAGDTTLTEALNGLAGVYQSIDITDVNSAVDAAQKATTETAKYLSDITAACA
ncbi:hypothetical protein [Streptosporangium sp. KLBMP 9127]|nr:hypothetical protein [Streptosporangium sp. KLBMP 9127]